jgi:hypothetical protein
MAMMMIIQNVSMEHSNILTATRGNYSAHYEYRFQRAGIQVVYCAEQFENDSLPPWGAGSNDTSISSSVGRRLVVSITMRPRSAWMWIGEPSTTPAMDGRSLKVIGGANQIRADWRRRIQFTG